MAKKLGAAHYVAGLIVLIAIIAGLAWLGSH